jgi:glycosyltransferase involved in cell wall biosynthesis
MRKMKPQILMVGPHPQQMIGGVSAMITTILNSDLPRQFQIHHIATVVPGSKRGKLWTALMALGRFLWHLIRRPIQLVYVHVGGDKSIYRKSPFILLGKLFGKKILLHWHGGNVARYYHSRSVLGEWYLRSVIRLSDRILAVSEHTKVALQRFLPGHDIHALPNAIDTSELSVARRSSVNGAPARVLYMGHLLPEKGIYDLVKAMPRIIVEAPDTKFLFCGPYEVEKVRQICQRKGLMPFVEHVGPIPMQERLRFYQRADILVLPSYDEGMPIVVLEAMAIGLPIVTTPVGGIPEIIKNGIHGFLIKPGDTKALASRVLTLIKDPALRHRMGQSNQIKANEFDVTLFAKRLAGHLHELIESSTERSEIRDPKMESTSQHGYVNEANTTVL